MKKFLFLLIIVSMYFKTIKIFQINLYVILSIIFTILLLLKYRNKVFTISNSNFRNGARYIYLFLLFTIFSYSFGTTNQPDLDSLLIVASSVYLYYILYRGIIILRVNVSNIVKVIAYTGVFSSVLLILQVYISFETFDVISKFETWGLVTDYAIEYSGYVSVLYQRGRGLSLSIYEYSIHLFIPLYYFLLKFLKQKKLSIKYLVVLCILLLSMYISFTESLFITILIVFILNMFIVKYQRRDFQFLSFIMKFIILIALPAMFMIVLNYSMSRITLLETTDVSDRLYYWDTSISMLMKNPLTGVGLGNFKENYIYYKPYLFNFSFVPSIGEPHSMLFQLLAETGIIGTFLFLSYLVSNLFVIYKITLKNRNSFILKIVFLSLLSFTIQSFFGNHFVYLDFYIYGVLIAVIARENKLMKGEK